ncbi:ArsR/SmtB family transcription factor [Parasulfitobacter algicola]|uniref:Helix-turn-helix domain-containing protein n=1 Tax=Parasulfitobacter algicola TaxID=2614809 RepID=A0ABX2ISX8_9RHOB|nr:helix-turn-helix domain-containing protein [Sulfitobacter algicola]NSX55106.1 helix-turn-helix domain-containing protein [Sulfitobacter algicola]
MDAIFKALNDPTRRALLDSLRHKDGQTLQELEAQLDMTRFGVMKHLGLLEDASLIITLKKGRFKYHYLNALPLQEVIDRWIEPLLAKPAARAVLDLKNTLEGVAEMTTKPDFMMQTYIRCTQDALWHALSDADAATHYHFVANRVEENGDEITYYAPDGTVMLICNTIKTTPKTRLEVSFEPKWSGPDMPASRAVYLIEPEGPICKLTLEHYDIPAGQEGVADGWQRMLAGLKTWLETGQDAKFGRPQTAA